MVTVVFPAVRLLPSVTVYPVTSALVLSLYVAVTTMPVSSKSSPAL